MATTSQPRALRATSFSPADLIDRHPLAAYFALAFAGAWLAVLPLVLARTGLVPLPLTLPALPFMILGALAGPGLAALLVTAATGGRAGVAALLRRCVQWRVGLRWYALILVGNVLVLLLAASPFVGAAPLVALARQWPLLLSVYLPTVLTLMVLGTHAAEEVGWRGVALPRLQARLGPLAASLLLGASWGVWHIPGLLGGWLGPFTSLGVAGLILSGMGFSVIATWVYNHTGGSVFIAILLHSASSAAGGLGVRLLPAELPGWVHAVVYASGPAAIGYGACAALLVLLTRGQLGYRRG